MKKKGREGRQGVLHDHTVAYTTLTHTLSHTHTEAYWSAQGCQVN